MNISIFAILYSISTVYIHVRTAFPLAKADVASNRKKKTKNTYISFSFAFHVPICYDNNEDDKTLVWTYHSTLFSLDKHRETTVDAGI